jgi:hypothetical protein
MKSCISFSLSIQKRPHHKKKSIYNNAMFNNKITHPKPLMHVVHHQKNSNAIRTHTKQCENSTGNTLTTSNRQQLVYGIETNNRK